MTSQDTPAPTGSRLVSPWWRALAIFLALVIMLGWAASSSMTTQLQAQIQHAQKRLSAIPQIRMVAVLLDDQRLPAMLVTYIPKEHALQVERLNEVREGREDSMQVWTIAGDGKPRSLGIIESKYKTLQLPVSEDALKGVTELAISAENKGGLPDGAEPSLPWLFKGWLVQKSI